MTCSESLETMTTFLTDIQAYTYIYILQINTTFPKKSPVSVESVSCTCMHVYIHIADDYNLHRLLRSNNDILVTYVYEHEYVSVIYTHTYIHTNIADDYDLQRLLRSDDDIP